MTGNLRFIDAFLTVLIQLLPMEETVELLLNIARKSYMGADFKQAAHYAVLAKPGAQGRAWLEVQRILILTSRELMLADSVTELRKELLDFLRTAPDSLKAKTHYLLAQIYAYQHEWSISKSHIECALQFSLETEHKEDFAYALFGRAMIEAYRGSLEQAIEFLQKLDIVLEAHPKSEIEISAYLLKTFIAMKQGKTDQAISFCWQCYEVTKRSGQHVTIPVVFSYLASLHFDKKAYSEAQSYLSLGEKGVTADAQPFLYSFFEREKGRLAKVLPKSDYDLIVDTHAKIIHEKEKGVIDFRNQHTLLDLALLFLKNPQKSFTKEQLIKEVWGMTYNPAVHDNLIYVTIKRLRLMIEPNLENPKYILRNRQGYYFDNSHSLMFKLEEQAI